MKLHYFLWVFVFFMTMAYATDYIVDENMDLRGNDVYNGTSANFTIFYQDGVKVLDVDDNTTMTSYVNGVNTTMTSYVNAQDVSYNSSMKTYADAQDLSYNSTMTSYVDGRDTAYNSSIKIYIDALDLAYNTTMTNYVDGRDVVFNSSMKTYADSIVTALSLVYCALAGCTMAGDIDMGTNNIINAENVNATNLDGDLESENVKSPPANPGAGYAISYFVSNFSTIIASYFNIDGDKFMGDFDAMDYSITNGSYLNFTNFYQDGVKVLDVDDNTTMTSYVDGEDAKNLALTGGTMTGNVSHGDDIYSKFGGSDDACIFYNGSALIISSVASDC